ncbi:MAG: DUF885 domain-containing protein, partial [Planctomycetes bacterium]|nr:DUF885 domain-containing protein [Planctomycetota bacterium]
MTPDQNLFLVNESDEFWRWNAPTFSVGPGQHVLKVKAHSPFAQLDGLVVSRSLAGHVALEFKPPSDSPSQHWLFYDHEPVFLTAELSNRRNDPQTVRLSYSLRNYMDEEVAAGQRVVTLGPNRVHAEGLEPGLGWAERPSGQPSHLRDYGIFHLTVTAQSEDGVTARELRFLRLPKLEHPRLLFRKDEVADIRARMAKYPKVFERYAAWLRRECEQGDFLPKGLAGAALLPMTQYRDLFRISSQARAWREYDLAWRMLGCQFAALFLERPGETFFQAQLASLLKATGTDMYCMYHHHGPFFPGAETALFDLAALNSDEPKEAIQRLFGPRMGDMNVFPWTLVALEEPLTPEKRAMLGKIMEFTVNWDRFFAAHCGTRGGLWWLNPRTWCHCSTSGYMLTALYLSNVFGEPRLFDKPYFRGLFTFHDYAHPRFDNKGLLGPLGPPGEPVRWLTTALCRHPLEKQRYALDEWFRQLNGQEEPDVDGMFKRLGSACLPIALALGWYEPSAPVADWVEMPPTTLFDVDGVAAMKSSWDADLTEVRFMCGARDHGCRHHPTSFEIQKAGEFLIGTASLFGDDGNPVPYWGNVVTVGDGWAKRWRENLWHCRADEHFIINRFSPSTWQYISRDRRLYGFAPAEGGWGGGLDMHGHTQSAFMKEGEVLAYETRPEFDYVAGDGTNAWPVREVSELYRQLVFIKPDVLVVYDRVKLGPDGKDP